MKCSQAQPNLLDYSRGLLDPAEAQGVGGHLETCQECRAALESEMSLAASLSAVPMTAPSADVWGKVASQIHAQKRPAFVFGGIMGTYARRVAAVAAALLVIAVSVFLSAPWKSGHSERDSIRQAATLIQVQPASQPSDDQLTRTTDDMMNVIEKEL